MSHSENSASDPVPIGPVTVVGSGVLGAQIAFQTAYFGHDVTVYDVDAAALEKADARFDQLVGTYRDFFTGREPGDADAARRRLTGTTDLEAAAREWAERLAQGPTKTIGYAKRLLNRSLDVDRATLFEEEAMIVELVGGTADCVTYAA